MDLPRGITGFRDAADPPLPECDFVAFRSNCYAAARALGGRVLSIETGIRADRNFVLAILEFPLGSVAVLLNAHFAVLGFAEPNMPGNLQFNFIDAPELADVLRSLGTYLVLDSSELNATIALDHCKHLAPSELDQMNYWKPQRVGDLVFNFWD